MTTKRATLRKGKSSNKKTVAKRSDTRAKRKAATAKKTTAAAAVVASTKRDMAVKATATPRPKKTGASDGRKVAAKKK